MKKTILMLLLLAILIGCMPGYASFGTRQEMRDAYRAVGVLPERSPYAAQPAIAAPYDAGALTEEVCTDALAYLNFLRAVAGLETLERSRIYDYQCQRGAVLLAALDYADHNAPQPADMDQNFYDSAHLATTSSNLAKFNWMRPTILREGLAYFVRDDGDANLSVLGHRRWLLNPLMADTGFGLANSKTGMSYVVMYAHDFGNADAQWSEVAWPAQGVFPVELMHANLAWSISMNPEIYDVGHSQIRVILTEETSGLHFEFDCTAQAGDGYCTVSLENYGSGPCVIFRPDFSGADFADYHQNQRWNVQLTGLRTKDGQSAELAYTVEMASLYVQEVANVELSQLEAMLVPEETLMLTAAVIPAYADDLTIVWTSSDEGVAAVDENGTVTAVAPGECEIIAESPNGKQDVCAVTVIG